LMKSKPTDGHPWAWPTYTEFYCGTCILLFSFSLNHVIILFYIRAAAYPFCLPCANAKKPCPVYVRCGT
jgi:hypothetical protein